MPKIIENLSTALVAEARRQMAEAGYSAMTVRSVAAACGVGVGTVYNYYPSKDALVAAFMLEDWRRCLDTIDAAAQDAREPAPVLRCIYDQLRAYIHTYHSLFHDKNAVQSFAAAFGRYHGQFRATLAHPLEKFFPGDPFLPEFIAEALLSWTMEGKGYGDIDPVLRKLYGKA